MNSSEETADRVVQKCSLILMRPIGVYRAFNSEYFDKKKFLKSFYFGGDRLKIL